VAKDKDTTVGGIGKKDVLANLNAFWKDKRYDYSSGDLIYMGVCTYHDNATSEEDWEIWKFTYGADGIARIEGPLKGSWTGRASLAWGV